MGTNGQRLHVGWFKKRSEIVATQSDRYFLLYRDDHEVRAMDASKFMRSGNFPGALKVRNYEYRVVEDEDTFIFWDELRDPSNRTVGFTFLLPDSATLANSYLLTESKNVTFEGEEVRVLLRACEMPTYECVQSFHSEVYRSISDPRECLMVLWDYSNNPIAFELHDGLQGV